MSQVINPVIPYQGPIHEGLHEGKIITIKGQVPYGVEKVVVSLMSGLDSNCDRPLHLSIRFKNNTVVRNTYQYHKWGEEETQGCFPFIIGRDFLLMIEVNRLAYKISVNGTHCWDFRHRIPFSRVSQMLIDGDVSIERIDYINAYSHCSSPETASSPITSGGGISGPMPTLPCTLSIYGGVKPGMSIYISGRPIMNARRFAINIQNGISTSPAPDIAFHFDVRFFSYAIVRNSRMNGVWSSEETSISHFPFVPETNFDMIIKVQSDSYKIMLNSQHFFSFRHRLTAFPHFNVLSIESDVVITSVRYI